MKRLAERRLENLALLVIDVDGVICGDYHVLVVIGVDREGKKHVLGMAEGASENQAVVKGLLEDLVRRGSRRIGNTCSWLMARRRCARRLMRSSGGESDAAVRHHKIENVMGYLPDHLKEQTRAAMRAAFRLPAKEGMARLEKQAEWLEREYPSAAASLREGLAEMFTVNRLGLSRGLMRCLVSTNVIESSTSGVGLRTRRVCR